MSMSRIEPMMSETELAAAEREHLRKFRGRPAYLSDPRWLDLDNQRDKERHAREWWELALKELHRTKAYYSGGWRWFKPEHVAVFSEVAGAVAPIVERVELEIAKYRGRESELRERMREIENENK